jgi:hypothetical protein
VGGRDQEEWDVPLMLLEVGKDEHLRDHQVIAVPGVGAPSDEI